MTRPLRIEYPGAVYHITARGNARQDIFLDDADRDKLLNLLAKEIRQQGWLCHAYCLMNNHYHLLVETPEPNLSTGMRRLNGTYTQAFNRRHQRVGHLFQGRYKSILVDKQSYLLELCRYIVLNPVRANLVEQAGDWSWSSYAASLGKAPRPQWLTTEWILSQFADQTVASQQAYADFVHAGLTARSPWKQLRGQVWLGSDAFRKTMEQRLKESPRADIASASLQPTRPTAAAILEAVCRDYHTSLDAITTRKHKTAYHSAVYLLRRAANLCLKDVATKFGISISRVSHIQRAVEDGPTDTTLAALIKRYNVL